MQNKIIIISLITLLHNIFTAMWIGGMLTLVLSVMPAIKNSLEPGPQAKKFIKEVQRRHSRWVYVSLTGLILTGLLLSNRNPAYEGFLSFSTTYSMALSIKHILMAGMVLITLYRALVLGRRESDRTAREKRSQQLLILNLVLGIIVLLISGLLPGLA